LQHEGKVKKQKGKCEEKLGFEVLRAWHRIRGLKEAPENAPLFTNNFSLWVSISLHQM
jgi:hypothetical protein